MSAPATPSRRRATARGAGDLGSPDAQKPPTRRYDSTASRLRLPFGAATPPARPVLRARAARLVTRALFPFFDSSSPREAWPQRRDGESK